MKIHFFGGDGKEETPVPIPNTEVKLFSADGTARVTEWESRTPPNFFIKPGILFVKIPGFLVFYEDRYLFTVMLNVDENACVFLKNPGHNGITI